MKNLSCYWKDFVNQEYREVIGIKITLPALKNLNIVSEFILNQAEFLNNLLCLTLLDPEQAKIILYYSLENNINANEAIKLFGWVVANN